MGGISDTMSRNKMRAVIYWPTGSVDGIERLAGPSRTPPLVAIETRRSAI